LSVHLLDVNVLLALCDPAHVNHEAAHGWFRAARPEGWATCPLTENAFIRIASQSAYPGSPGGPGVVRDLLRRFCACRHHRFWPADISLCDEATDLSGHVAAAHVTDVYLLALAVRRRGRLATFDRRIPADAVRGGLQAIEALAG
jgi:toxin-antitoxin system PIN domain toxin